MLIKIGKTKEPFLDTTFADKKYFVINTMVAKIRDKYSVWLKLGNKTWKLKEGEKQDMLSKKQRIDTFLKDYSRFPMKTSITDVIQISAKL